MTAYRAERSSFLLLIMFGRELNAYGRQVWCVEISNHRIKLVDFVEFQAVMNGEAFIATEARSQLFFFSKSILPEVPRAVSN